jgi:hypothetical protein
MIFVMDKDSPGEVQCNLALAEWGRSEQIWIPQYAKIYKVG